MFETKMALKYPYIASGFKDDCLLLLSSFKKENDIRFESFCRCWQQMKFSLVFLCRENFTDLMEFCEEALYIAKQFFLLPYTFKERIGGLYLLYGLYYKMPLDNALAKIRITLSDFKQLTKLHKEIREGEHFDANYILSKMLVDNAFAFCIFDKEMGLDKQYKKKSSRNINNHLSVLPNITSMNKPNGILQKVGKLSEEYEENKLALSKSMANDKVVNLFDSNILSNIMTDFHQMYKVQDNTCVIKNFNTAKKIRKRGNRTRPILGHGFDTDSSENENGNNLENEEFRMKPEPMKCISLKSCINDGYECTLNDIEDNANEM